MDSVALLTEALTASTFMGLDQTSDRQASADDPLALAQWLTKDPVEG